MNVIFSRVAARIVPNSRGTYPVSDDKGLSRPTHRNWPWYHYSHFATELTSANTFQMPWTYQKTRAEMSRRIPSEPGTGLTNKHRTWSLSMSPLHIYPYRRRSLFLMNDSMRWHPNLWKALTIIYLLCALWVQMQWVNLALFNKEMKNGSVGPDRVMWEPTTIFG